MGRGGTKDMHQPGDRNKDVIKSKMEKLGVDASKMIERGRTLDQERGRKRERSRKRGSRDAEDIELDDAEMEDTTLSNTQAKKKKRSKSEAARREASVTRGHSKPRDPSQIGLYSDEAVIAAKKLDRQGRRGWHGGAGEGDNRKAEHLIKWMNTGKKRNGTHYQR